MAYTADINDTQTHIPSPAAPGLPGWLVALTSVRCTDTVGDIPCLNILKGATQGRINDGCVKEARLDCPLKHDKEVTAEKVFQGQASSSADWLVRWFPEGWVTGWKDVATEQLQRFLLAVAGERNTPV